MLKKRDGMDGSGLFSTGTDPGSGALIMHSIRWTEDRKTWFPQMTIHRQNTIKYSEKNKRRERLTPHSTVKSFAYRSRYKHFVTAINRSFRFRKGHWSDLTNMGMERKIRFTGFVKSYLKFRTWESIERSISIDLFAHSTISSDTKPYNCKKQNDEWDLSC